MGVSGNMDKQVNTAEKLAQWGFAGVVTPQILDHAKNVLSLRGAPIAKVISSLGVSSEASIEACLESRPDGVKPLIWLRDNMQEVAPRYDELMAIELDVPYISQPLTSMVVHPVVAKKEMLAAIDTELHKWETLPMQVDGATLLLLFADSAKMLRFTAMGRNERRQSKLFTFLASMLKCKLDDFVIHAALASTGVHLFYMQKVAEVSEGKASSNDSLQVIYQADGESSPIAASLVRILNEAIAKGVNDVAVSPDRNTGGARIFFRKNQKLRYSGIYIPGTEKDEFTRLLLARSGANKDGGRLMAPDDGNAIFLGKNGQAFLRLSFIPLDSSQGESISTSVRVLPRTARPIKMDDLGIPEDLQVELKRLMRRKYGLIVVCGPTGSGKSTSIGGMMCWHVEEYGDSLKRMTVEDPVERVLPGVSHIDVSQHTYRNEKEEEVNKFAMSLRAILRHDPDLVFVGEVRDREGCMVSVDAANTGHLVLTTTHANDPVLGFRRLASFLTSDRRFDLVTVLEGILAQRLVTTLCEHCSTVHPIGKDEIEDLTYYCRVKGLKMPEQLPPTHRKANPEGCEHCIDGYDGMLPVHGLLVMNPEVRQILLSNNESDWLKAEAASETKFTLFGAAMKLFNQGVISFESVML